MGQRNGCMIIVVISSSVQPSCLWLREWYMHGSTYLMQHLAAAA